MRGWIVIPELPWPKKLGGQLYAHHVLERLVARGCDVGVMTFAEPDPVALGAWPLAGRVPVRVVRGVHRLDALHGKAIDSEPSDSEKRWAGYWGWSDQAAARVGHALNKSGADWVLSFGLGSLAVLTRLPQGTRHVWCAHDEPALHHLSLLRSARTVSAAVGLIRDAAAMCAYQRAHRRFADAVVAVAPSDESAMRGIGGFNRTLLLRTGIDRDYWKPIDEGVGRRDRTVVFWGNLDFQPNIDAVRWFAHHVWPLVLRDWPGAEWRIVGRGGSDAITNAIKGLHGARLIGEVEDVRPWACGSAVSVAPMVTGTGIKTKLLEACGMGCAVVATGRAVRGLAGQGGWLRADRAAAFADAIGLLFSDPPEAQRIGELGRRWITDYHDWDTVVDGLGPVLLGAAWHGRRIGHADHIETLQSFECKEALEPCQGFTSSSWGCSAPRAQPSSPWSTTGARE